MTLTDTQPLLDATSSATYFDEKVQGAYTHGLESIYALENVDPGSIRPLTMTSHPEPLPSETQVVPLQIKEQQLHFSFAPELRSWMTAHTHKEPLEVLELSRPADSFLRSQGLNQVGDLLELNLLTIGLGQGLYDEISSKLAAFKAERPLHSTRLWDWEAFVRILCYRGDLVSAYRVLKTYDLEHLLHLPRNVQAQAKSVFGKSDPLSLNTPECIEAFREGIEELFAVQLVRWMLRREGLATEAELWEQLELGSLNPKQLDPASRFLKDVFTPSAPLLSTVLFQVEEDVYAVDEERAFNYHSVCREAVSFFRPQHIVYELSHLVTLLARQAAQRWKDWSSELISASLRYSPLFVVWKDRDDRIVVRLS